jgi:hypothetical protein
MVRHDMDTGLVKFSYVNVSICKIRISVPRDDKIAGPF